MTPANTKAPFDVQLLKALSHPLRQRILVAIKGRVASPSQIAEELNEHLGKVSYHFRILADCGALELVETAPARGALEHFYRATTSARIDDPEHWGRLPVETRRAVFDETLQEIWDHVVTAGRTGGFDDPETHISWVPLELDDEAYKELTEFLERALNFALELHSKTIARGSSTSKGELHRTELAMVHFQRSPETAAATEPLSRETSDSTP